MNEILLAVILGAAFGIALDRAGATNPGLIIRMLNLTNLHLMKAILGGIGLASILLFGGLMLGVVDPGHMSVKGAYLGVFVGGLMLGVGFAVAGYCPGTSITAMATGRVDGLVFALGGLVGAGAYMLSHAAVKGTGILEPIAGGNTTLGVIAGTDYPALISGVSGEMIGLGTGILFLLIAFLLPQRLRVAAPAS